MHNSALVENLLKKCGYRRLNYLSESMNLSGIFEISPLRSFKLTRRYCNLNKLMFENSNRFAWLVFLGKHQLHLKIVTSSSIILV